MTQISGFGPFQTMSPGGSTGLNNLLKKGSSTKKSFSCPPECPRRAERVIPMLQLIPQLFRRSEIELFELEGQVGLYEEIWSSTRLGGGEVGG